MSLAEWQAQVRRRINSLSVAAEQREALVEEIAQDLEARHEALLQEGVDDQTARHKVLALLDAGPGLDAHLRQLAGWSSVVESTVRSSPVGESLLQDGRFAIRAFRRRPLFSAVAVLTIALGIAATTTVFSLVKTVMRQPLPVSHFERVVMVWHQDPTTGRDRMTISPLELREYQRGGARSFDAVAAIRGLRLIVGAGAAPIAVSGIQASAGLFDTLGVTPVLGRGFSLSASGADEVVITSEFWRAHLAADPDVIGKELTIRAGAGAVAQSIDGVRTIVGVLPEGLSLPYRAADVWLPLPPELPDTGAGSGLLVFARLAPGAALGPARTEAAAIAQGFLAQSSERNSQVGSRLTTLREEVVGDITPTLRLLSAAVALVGLIVCANIANMLLSRLTERQRELSVRRALGATRGRLVRQLLTESLVLGAAGGAVGLGLAYWMTRAVAAVGPATVPRVGDVRLDLPALGVAALASVTMGVVFGLVPALRIARAGSQSLRQRTGNTAGSGRLRELLMIAEFALAFVVLVATGLVFVSSRALESTPVGYDPKSALTFRVSLPATGYAGPEQQSAFFETLLDRLRALPGVTHAGAISILPQMDTNRTLAFELDGGTPNLLERPSARFRVATPGYFEGLGIRVLRGRTFQSSDLPLGAIIVSDSLAKRFWPGVDPIGRQIRLGLPDGPRPWSTVVGVVEDVRQWINTPPEPTLYWANARQSEFSLVVGTAGDPSLLTTAATRVIRELDPTLPVFDVRTMEDRLDRSQQLTYERFRTAIMGAFGLAALLLASLGIYGVVRYSVAQRTQEFGIRMAIGGSPAEIFGMVLRQSLRTTAIGGAIGTLGSIFAGRFLANVLYGGVSAQPFVTLGAVIVLAGVSVLAATGPAREASRVDPLSALRSE